MSNMTTDHTAPELLEAVGIDWRTHTDMAKWRVGDGSLKTIREILDGCYTYTPEQATYTGPALGTPELDAILLVAGLEWLRQRNDWRFKHDFAGYITKSMADDDPLPWDDWLIWHCDTPGHALARAIREVQA